MLCVEVDAPELGETGLLAFIPSCLLTGSVRSAKRIINLHITEAYRFDKLDIYQSKGVPLLLAQSNALDGHIGVACLRSQ